MKIKMDDKELIIKYRSRKVYKDIYDKICENTMGINLNEINIKYKVKKENNKIRIFGDTFIYNNYNNCKIIWNNKKYNLVSHLKLEKMNENKNLIEIKLRGIKNIILKGKVYDLLSHLDIKKNENK